MMQTRDKRRRLWSCHLNEGCVGSTESIVTKIARTFGMCSIRIHLRWVRRFNYADVVRTEVVHSHRDVWYGATPKFPL